MFVFLIQIHITHSARCCIKSGTCLLFLDQAKYGI